MVRQPGHYTLSESSLEYLKDSSNKSRTIDEALELYKNKDKKTKEEIITPEFEVTEIAL